MGMTISPYFQTDELSELALEFIATTEAARDPERPFDAVSGAISIAYRNAQVIEATPNENFQNGIIASINAVEPFTSDPDPAIRAFARNESERLVELRDDFLINMSMDDVLTPTDSSAISSDRVGTHNDTLTATAECDAWVVPA